MTHSMTFVTLVTAGVIAAAQVSAQEQEGMPNQDALMAAYAAAAAPGPQHEAMASMAGKYEAKVKSWMDPTAPPIESTGSAEFKMILGGRYLVQHYTGAMMGQRFEGMGITAYDKVQDKVVDAWVDNMGTGILVMKGSFDEAGKVLSSSGSAVDPVTGEEVGYRSVTTMVSDAEHRFEMFMSQGDQEMQVLEITYTRSM